MEEKDNKIMFLNALAALMWRVAFYGTVFGNDSSVSNILVCIIFIAVYMAVCFIPFICIVADAAAGFMYVWNLWTILDHIGNSGVKIALKVVAVVIVALIEMAMVVNVTLPWVTKRMRRKEGIRG